MKPLIGISCNFYHPDSHRSLFKNKRLIYHEQFLSRLIYAAGGLPVPISHTESPLYLGELVHRLDGVILSGGGDVAPESYGEKALDENRWPGDRYLDLYQLEIIRAAFEDKKPILGICRGIQILNVFFGGTLHQDLPSEGVAQVNHRCESVYEHLTHRVGLVEGLRLHQWYGIEEGIVNSVHHQAIKKLGRDLVVNAYSEDGIIEGVEYRDPSYFLLGVQWHPEWSTDKPLLDPHMLISKLIETIK